jgi:predicted Rossmann fold flavoprotein
MFRFLRRGMRFQSCLDAKRVIVAGGGAAGFFAAIACAEANPLARVLVVEKGARFLSKVRISGGGRCNVTHACFDPRAFAERYPRGGKALIGPFHRFQARDVVGWFESRGVPLKTEGDGRMFPVSNSSESVVKCLMDSAARAGVETRGQAGVAALAREPNGEFQVTLQTGERLGADAVLLAIGGARTASLAHLATDLGHSLQPPVPSLFALDVEGPWLKGLAGLSVEAVSLSVAESRLKEQGPLLITHRGVSGPAVLRLSAWGAREFHARDYRVPLRVNWLPEFSGDGLRRRLDGLRSERGARKLANAPLAPLPQRLWERLALKAGMHGETRCSELTREQRDRFGKELLECVLDVGGKTMNQDEFVTCGGIPLAEVNFKTMESRVVPNLYFAGEILDIDGITGGFNFQAAWTTGWIAGRAMSGIEEAE